MSSRHHQSPILLEQSVSPPHLLSPELVPAAAISPPVLTSQLSELPTTRPSAALNSHSETQQATMDAQNDAAEPAAERSTTPLQAEPQTEPEPEPQPQMESNTLDTTITATEITQAAPSAPAGGGNTDLTPSGASNPSDRTLSSETQPAAEGSRAAESEGTPAATENAPATESSAEAATHDGSPPVADSTEPEPVAVPEPEPEIEDTTPEWVKFEEDTSVPDEEEMAEIEEAEIDRPSATNMAAMEEQFFSEIDDPEQRPAKKLRMSWVIKGVRGTRERPNMAKVMNSPAVCVDGMYWSIKFYPRGDNCPSLSAFVRCSRIPPKQADEMPEHTFALFDGPPDADFSKDYEPTVSFSAPNTQKVREQPKPKKKDEEIERAGSKDADQNATPEPNQRSPSPDSSAIESREDDDDEANEGSDEADEKDLKDWRVSAQLGMAIYNPSEPRTAHLQSDGHQFSKHCDDWGWVNFVGPWEEIQRRKRGQRRPLLQNDTLAIDAYVRIYDDPTQSLWWHDSKVESQWPSKQLAGYYPMGTPALYHSPAVAGITAWSILAPFRKIIQTHDGGKWLRNSAIAPTPLICQTQIVLQQMRDLIVGECYVSVFKIIEELIEADEPWEDVKSFWEVFRRGLELEFKDDDAALRNLSNIFDADGKSFRIPQLPVPGSKTVASGLEKYLQDSSYHGALPNFLPVLLNRQQFNKEKREWILHEDRVELSDQMDLTQWSTDSDAKYTLYGFVVHVKGRASGKFYSILRPGGIGTKWLAFEDGNGNKVFSYTKKKIQEFEGLEGSELKNFSGEREKAYMAMYVRDSCWQEYLPMELEPYFLPKWLKNCCHGMGGSNETIEKEEALQAETDEKKQAEEGIKVELYLDETVEGCENKLELHDLRCTPEAEKARQLVMVAMDKTDSDLRNKIAEAFQISDPSKIILWDMAYRGVGKFCRAELGDLFHRRKLKIKKCVYPGDIFRVWITVLPHDDEKKSYRHLLPKLAEMGLEKRNATEKSIESSADANTQPANESASASNQEAASGSAVDETNHQPADTSSSHTEDSITTGIATPATGETGDSAPDMEQASVEAAVTQDVENTSAAGAATVTTSDVVPTNALHGGGQETTASSEDTMSIVTPTPDTPLEHNHPVEAVQAPELVQSMLSGAEDALRSAVAANNDSNVPVSDEISPEDAAAIAALLAADAEDEDAALTATTQNGEQPSENTAEAPAETNAEVTAAEPETQRSPTPAPIARVYGFVHVFDADQQKFIAQQPFNPEVESETGTAVRKLLGYADDKEIRIWKRDGPTGTAPIGGTTSFSSNGFSDGFTLLVGDYLSEGKIEELKVAGKFWQPAQLIKFLIMSKRRHPILSVTSSDPVEITEFGADYFKGPIVNGQPHGEDCLLITSSGHTYEGPLVAGLKSGSNGKITYQNGDTYKGEWLNDECHGQGEHIEARTGNRYVGGFENGKRWGEGVTYWKVADQQAAMCQVCYGEEIDALFYDCGHVCACVECAKQCENCPICRKSVQRVVKMFRA